MMCWSFDVGTTTSFTASHPITAGLGADSAVYLLMLAMVQINDMDNMGKGFVARNGFFNEGAGEHLCLGIFQGLTSCSTRLAINAQTGVAGENTAAETDVQIDYDLSGLCWCNQCRSSIVDAVFGNGSYCESQMGADERSYSYRV